MINIFDWLGSHAEYRNRPWLLLGKGPSFARYSDYDTRGFVTLGLNDVARQVSVDVLHLIDISVLDRLGSSAIDGCQFLLAPWFPHEDYRLPLVNKIFHRPSKYSLNEHVRHHPLLGELSRQGRLLWYDASTASAQGPGEHPVVDVGSFSAAAVTNLLAQAGVKTIRTLGIDGGIAYAADFGDLLTSTRLDAGQDSYDLQFADIARCLVRFGIDFAPLDCESPAVVYVGTQPEQMLPTKVLEYSIRKHASLSVRVIPLFKAIDAAGLRYQAPSSLGARQRTPFSFQRFTIPQLKGHRGRAIYLDSDMQVFKDIRRLWQWPFDGADVLTVEKRGDERKHGPQFSVMLLDCETLRWDIHQLLDELAKGASSYEEMIYQMQPAKCVRYTLPRAWNDLEHYEEGVTALTHYTDMVTQPWITCENVLGRIWCAELFEAVDRGFISLDFVHGEVEKGWIRPSLLYQLEHRIVDPLMLPARVVRRDQFEFVPPLHFAESLKSFTGYGSVSCSRAKHVFRRAYAWGRYVLWASGAMPLVRLLIRCARKILRVLRPRQIG